MQATINIDDVFEHIAPMLQSPGRRTIIEIGAHDGTHTNLLRLLCREPPILLAIEPDPRNIRVMHDAGQSVLPVAISNETGDAEWFASGGITPNTESRLHTDSSSLKRPTRHLEVHPWCEFTEGGRVKTMTLDAATAHLDPSTDIDLVWADVQGAQLEVIRGGGRTLARTRYLFIEVHPEPLYEGEPTLIDMIETLEKETNHFWSVVAQYPADVLLKREYDVDPA